MNTKNTCNNPFNMGMGWGGDEKRDGKKEEKEEK